MRVRFALGRGRYHKMGLLIDVVNVSECECMTVCEIARSVTSGNGASC